MSDCFLGMNLWEGMLHWNVPILNLVLVADGFLAVCLKCLSHQMIYFCKGLVL